LENRDKDEDEEEEEDAEEISTKKKSERVYEINERSLCSKKVKELNIMKKKILGGQMRAQAYEYLKKTEETKKLNLSMDELELQKEDVKSKKKKKMRLY